MLTRLCVSGFKNLVEVDVRFGPFTCVAGGNAVGKSNLFDAIMFLAACADRPILEAAMEVRDRLGRSSDIRALFHATVVGRHEIITFAADMIVPPVGQDDLGQPAHASITFLRYELDLRYVGAAGTSVRAGLQVLREQLTYIPLKDAARNLPFPHSLAWRRSVVHGRRASPFISTKNPGQNATILLHQEGQRGRAREFRAATLPRTVLSTVNAAENPTALLARREMQSWQQLQLEPTALRASDSFAAPVVMGSDGSHLAATLYNLSRLQEENQAAVGEDVYLRISDRLSQLVEDVRSVAVERDDTRELLTVHVTLRDGTTHPARSLSDGTLRFLALAVLEANPRVTGLLCFEEPENGIHPQRITAMLQLLRDLAVDAKRATDRDNPLRQVIINTHSPTVVALVPRSSVLFADATIAVSNGGVSSRVFFQPLERTWRAQIDTMALAVQRGAVIGFLSPIRAGDWDSQSSWADVEDPPVIMSKDVRQYVLQLEFPGEKRSKE